MADLDTFCTYFENFEKTESGKVVVGSYSTTRITQESQK